MSGHCIAKCYINQSLMQDFHLKDSLMKKGCCCEWVNMALKL